MASTEGSVLAVVPLEEEGMTYPMAAERCTGEMMRRWLTDHGVSRIGEHATSRAKATSHEMCVIVAKTLQKLNGAVPPWLDIRLATVSVSVYILLDVQ